MLGGAAGRCGGHPGGLRRPRASRWPQAFAAELELPGAAAALAHDPHAPGSAGQRAGGRERGHGQAGPRRRAAGPDARWPNAPRAAAGERGGSSTMPHKRNPVAAVAVLACAGQTPGLVAAVLVGDGPGARARRPGPGRPSGSPCCACSRSPARRRTPRRSCSRACRSIPRGCGPTSRRPGRR